MFDEQDIERLIQTITQAVMARLEAPVRSGPERRAWILVPLPTGRLAALARQTAGLAHQGFAPRVLAAAPVAGEIEGNARIGQFACPVEGIDQVDLGELLAGLRPPDLMVIGALGFDLARSLVGLKDDNPWVRLVSQALLKKLVVVGVGDDLAAGAGSPGDRLARVAAGLLRDLASLGIRTVGLDQLDGLVHGLAQVASTVSRAVGGLLTEADVEQLVAGGEKRLVLSRSTVVTPLAWSRSVELGLELVKEEA